MLVARASRERKILAAKHQPFKGHNTSARPTRHVRGESASLAVAAAFGVRQLVGAFARGTRESVASWLALAEDSGDKSPHSKRWRACERARLSRSQVCANALSPYPASCRQTIGAKHCRQDAGSTLAVRGRNARAKAEGGSFHDSCAAIESPCRLHETTDNRRRGIALRPGLEHR